MRCRKEEIIILYYITLVIKSELSSFMHSPGCNMDVLEQAGEAVRKWDTQRPQQIVPVGLHVLAGSALGIALATCVLVVGSDDVRDEVVVTAGSLEEENHKMQH